MLSAEAERKGLRAGPVISWETGWDISNKQHQERLRELQKEYRPRILLFEMDCQHWCILPNNADEDIREHMRQSEASSFSFVEEAAARQDLAGDFHLTENPG